MGSIFSLAHRLPIRFPIGLSAVLVVIVSAMVAPSDHRAEDMLGLAWALVP